MSTDQTSTLPLRLSFHQVGQACDVLQLEEFSPRPPEPGEVLVRILAAPLNPADLNTIEGNYGVKLELPATPGIEGCGEVLESRAADFKPGDRVIFLRRADTWSTHTTVEASALYPLPDGMDPLQAAMLKVNPATAWRLLRGIEALEAGDWIVQNAGNSAVGRCVIQLAGILGIRTISFVRRAEIIPELLSLGASHVFVDDPSGFDAARKVLDGANAALAFNAVGGESALRLLKLLRTGASHVTYGAMARKPLTVPNGLLIFRDLKIRGLWVTRWIESADREDVLETYDELAGYVASGRLIQPVDRVFPLADWKEAIERLDSPDRAGKVLFVP